MISSISRLIGTMGMWKAGNPPWIEARSPTRGTSMPNAMTMAATTAMPASGAGTTLVIFGITQMMAMVSATRPSMLTSGQAAIHTRVPSAPGTWKSAIDCGLLSVRTGSYASTGDRFASHIVVLGQTCPNRRDETHSAQGEGGPDMSDTTLKKVEADTSPKGDMGQRYLASGKHVSMRLWVK